MNHALPTAIMGGGPVALAAAAQLAARNMPFVLLEQGTNVGAAVWSWKHVRMFSPWEFNIDLAARELLLQAGWPEPDHAHMPTGEELVRDYLEPLSRLNSIRPFLKLNSKVTAVHRKGFDKMKTAGREQAPFIIEYVHEGRTQRLEAASVIDATGTWLTPNPIGASGNLADGEALHADRITYGIPDILGRDRERYAARNIVVIGSGHSAIQALTLLHELKLQMPETTIHWLLRKIDVSDAFGGGERDGLPARGALGARAKQYVRNGNVIVHTPVMIHRVSRDEAATLTLLGTKQGEDYAIERVDEVIVATGARPDFSFLRELRYAADSAIESVPELADLIDPNIHSCGTVRPHGEAELRQPERNFYIVGSKSYGRAPTFLLATGYEQVRSVVAMLAGDEEAAREVRLRLPETGVCSGAGSPEPDGGGSTCCTPTSSSYKPIAVTTAAASSCCGSTGKGSSCG
ncbi:NAD(P)-binding domain-containing protein [Paenibacillus soyae]|uniref:NAD(P)-binding domain-containing protein n=1 Tax=Paenibacillus soyae TaxID=2969249 RepID=A0A9X2MMV8_9BACL|nr:NAD(P)-binding domain-containing protein [Paenibacillus soyae]MCR2803606.1 NAD(P)-binding domain-containing protein [Paenibacillus soyae]